MHNRLDFAADQRRSYCEHSLPRFPKAAGCARKSGRPSPALSSGQDATAAACAYRGRFFKRLPEDYGQEGLSYTTVYKFMVKDQIADFTGAGSQGRFSDSNSNVGLL